MSFMYLVRHGQASFGEEEYDRLSPLGRRQAALAGEHLSRLGVTLDAAYCGALERQRDTAGEILARQEAPPPLETMPQFDEFDAVGMMAALAPVISRKNPAVARALPRMFQDLRAFRLVYEEVIFAWASGEHDAQLEQTWLEFLARVKSGLKSIMNRHRGGKNVLVVTSGGAICAAMHLAMGVPDQKALTLTWVIKNASLSSFLFNQKEFSLFTFNSTTHLELEGEPNLVTYR